MMKEVKKNKKLPSPGEGGSVSLGFTFTLQRAHTLPQHQRNLPHRIASDNVFSLFAFSFCCCFILSMKIIFIHVQTYLTVRKNIGS